MTTLPSLALILAAWRACHWVGTPALNGKHDDPDWDRIAAAEEARLARELGF